MVDHNPAGGHFQFLLAGELLEGINQVLEQIDVIVVMDTLHDRGDALQSHAGIH